MGDYAPVEGDLVCRARTNSGISYGTVPVSGDSHVDIVCDKHTGSGADDNYIIVVGGNLEYDQVFAHRNGTGWENRYNSSTVTAQSRVNYGGRRYNAGDTITVTADTPIDYALVPHVSHNVSVGKRKIYLSSDGKIDTTRQWEVLDNTGAVQFVGPQAEYFAILRLRTSRSQT